MLRGARYLVSDLAYWMSRSRWRALAVIVGAVAVVAVAVGAYLVLADGDDADPGAPGPAPPIISPGIPEDEASAELGFPASATANTTRVAGADPATTAAGVALAAHPSTGGAPGPDAVTLVDAEDWPAGIAAAALVADPIGAPILATEGGEVPEPTAAALEALDPQGSGETDGERAFRVGPAASPEDLEPLAIEGANPAEVAVGIADLRERLVGEPDHIVVASSDDPEFAMPAAAWAARSGDPVLFAQRDSLPAPTRRALRRREDTPVYVLGPESVISSGVVERIEEIAPSVERVAGEAPVPNAIEFARYADGSFGWNINDPGHGLVVASSSRPFDAGAAAPLSAGGSWGPLLLTDAADELPPDLDAYLLDLKPGYDDDPTRAVYNHVWVIGDLEAISLGVQGRLDDLAALVPVSSGVGAPEAGEPETER